MKAPLAPVWNTGFSVGWIGGNLILHNPWQEIIFFLILVNLAILSIDWVLKHTKID